ncbi:MAG: hypothetical protein KME45_17815 [Stenomitos rutilans HA7619-LM2]|nr:hypothetical protein [Stenomitos rutilans HA7619-LM2]
MNHHSEKQPWWPYIHAVAAIGLFLRLVLVFFSDRGYHPDEIFQYLEQAHRMVFGYGYIPWEYRFGIRNLIIPITLSIPLRLLKALQLDSPDIYIPFIKAILCLLSLSLIYGLYALGRTVVSEPVGRIAALIACFWYELMVFAPKSTPECLAAYLMVGALVCLVSYPRWQTALGLGVMGAGTIALRLQYAPAILVLSVAMIVLWRSHLSQMAIATAAFIVTVGLVGYIDYLTWGLWFGSYYHNYLYNQVYGVSNLFGRDPLFYYFERLTLSSAGIFPLSIVVAVRKRVPLLALWLSLLASILVTHSLIAHKEYRFVFAAVPLCLLLTAIAYWYLQQFCQRYPRTYARIPQALAVLLVAYACFSILDTTVLTSRNPLLEGYLYLSRQPNVSAVLNLKSEWYETGGYYYLHHPVPIYFSRDVNAIGPEGYGQYVSDILCQHHQATIPGFGTVRTFKEIDIRHNNHPPSHYAQLSGDFYQPQQGGVDGVFPQPVFHPPVQIFPPQGHQL